MACNKDADTKKLPEGTYIGTFQRELDWADNDTANITIIFSSNTWSGSSDKTKYPALCHGSYSINNSTINFINECPWTTEFDWSLILSGKYQLDMSFKVKPILNMTII